ncbi:MAG: putative toxin-antitoxin system toxin component, PIN family [Armatimonadetes bacterium CG_4_10_14_3_um_filter_66_18]|nr:MAG: putative toxin-antitoxin system toxin component, PIN family [Armatimonadetes bacterium CG07_land_8_20_14_0_80_59_28]PIY49840.1 MAG: putative toxin-antitoxin system toxin component, PIN family [Armatimonadetes bacterium CG_4_10_14_3_um_filter_66_18]PJB61642.1 MAG: putative toxin-antitoxin system toxin component, PIN family [Armatimonadetes bacterium CG_4_9_14_3_um_filter_66_14]
MLGAVLDTNAYVSAVICPHGVPAQIVAAWRREEVRLIVCEEILAEVAEILSLPRIRRKYPVTDEEVSRLLTGLRGAASCVPDAVVEPVVAADPDDDAILACAVAGRADFVVSGDPHLKELKHHRGIPILSPREFLNLLRDRAER